MSHLRGLPGVRGTKTKDLLRDREGAGGEGLVLYLVVTSARIKLLPRWS